MHRHFLVLSIDCLNEEDSSYSVGAGPVSNHLILEKGTR